MDPGLARFGAGEAVLDPEDGAVLALRHPARPGAGYLLDEETEPWHTREHRWGSGLVISSAGARRFAALTGRQAIAPGLELHVERAFGEHWAERYALRNTGPEPVTVTSWGICTPWRDVYVSAADALARAVHAHVWAGGAASYALAEPMDGAGPLLGLRLTEGELWAYSVESREPLMTGSNARGHLLLHATDAARTPHAFGGQPGLEIAPGGELVLAWEVGWYATRAAFRQAHPLPVELHDTVAEAGRPLAFRARDHRVVLRAPAGVAVRDGELRSDREGETYVELEDSGRRSHVAVSWHAPLEEVVRRRVRFLLDHQRASHRTGPGAGALLPFDVEQGLTVLASGWADFSDARERLGMGLLLGEALRRGCVDDAVEAEAALAAYRRFVAECVLTPDHQLREDSHRRDASPRLYDVPWLVLLFAADDPDLALRVLRGYYRRGGERFLAIGAGIAARTLAAELRDRGRDEDAGEVTGLLSDHARRSVEAGGELPAHEVNYEQSMVAPLLEILSAARELSRDERLDDAIATRLPWLLAFGGPQPHVRLRDIAIRHWDGYWFGREQLWGDTFPHHWSALTANVLLMLPPAVGEALARERGESAEALAERIYAANLIDFAPDGTATAAFVMPSCVSGRAAHRADPLANDQDWALYWPLALGALRR